MLAARRFSFARQRSWVKFGPSSSWHYETALNQPSFAIQDAVQASGYMGRDRRRAPVLSNIRSRMNPDQGLRPRLALNHYFPIEHGLPSNTQSVPVFYCKCVYRPPGQYYITCHLVNKQSPPSARQNRRTRKLFRD